MESNHRNGHTIQSVERALNILEEFSGKEKELGVTEIAKRLGLKKNTCFGLLKTLQNRGYVEQNPDTGKYRLGLKIFQLGQVYEEGLELREIARPYLQDLVEKTRETVHLVVRNRAEAVYIEKVEGPSAINIISQVGRSVNLHCTGVGKALLAYFPENLYREVLARGLGRFTEKTITDPGELAKSLEAIREKGYSIDDEEIEIGLRCIAAPIFNHRKEAIAAISISGPKTRITDEKIEEFARLVKTATGSISIKLGYR
ncbi:MAG: IclR family transcriptional regulator [Peptococcaceae bacterium]|jgi:DNA-binding IclR family transcriptional regulator|nr:IclR family transcriptional regulator [Peptococcaceae bacterium]MDH7525075.1 IclR family transcriptional regulator [Peptococcaceae bacterium]